MPMPMPADVALRLAGGVAAVVLAVPRRQVPPAYYRTQSLVMLGLLVVATLSLAATPGARVAAWVAGGSAVAAYLGSIAWGLGLPRVGTPMTAGVAIATVGLLIFSDGEATGPGAGVWALNAAGRLASAFLMGATLEAMLLGHHYLTAPAMSIDPLRRLVRLMAWGLAVRVVLAAVGTALFAAAAPPGFGGDAGPTAIFLAMRWSMGVVGPAIATYLTWETVRLRSTQSATGILYIAMTLVLFGELTALILSRDTGLVA